MGCCGSIDRYDVKIEIMCASNLPDVDIIGKIDPFVVTKYKGQDYKTDVKKGQDNPFWKGEDDNAIYVIEESERGECDIIFNLSDWDRFTSNDYVGTAIITREQQNITYNTPTEFDLPLLNKGENRGTLRVKITFIHEGDNPKQFHMAAQINNNYNVNNNNNNNHNNVVNTDNAQVYGTSNTTQVHNTTVVVNKTVVVNETVVVKNKAPRQKIIKDDGVEYYADEIDDAEAGGDEPGGDEVASGGDEAVGYEVEGAEAVDDAVDGEAVGNHAAGYEDAAGDEVEIKKPGDDEEVADYDAPNPDEAGYDAVDKYGVEAGAEPKDDKDKPREGSSKVLSGNKTTINIDKTYEFAVLQYNKEDRWLVSKKERNNDMITIVTQCSIDRIQQLKAMCKGWNGIISVAIYIKDNIQMNKSILKQLFDDMERLYSVILDISILYENNIGRTDEDGVDVLYPINHLRNLSLDNAETDLVFLLDVDFVPSLNMHNILLNNTMYCDELNTAKNNKTALVIPAFEVHTKNKDISAHPRTKAEIINMVNLDKASPFHISRFSYGHAPTNYSFWYNNNQVYNIEYNLLYEPYIIISRNKLRKYDERYRGYGMNKIIHIAGLALNDNIKFKVLPNIFVTAVEHKKSLAYNKVYGKRNIKQKQRKVWLKKLWKISLIELITTDKAFDNEYITKIKAINVENNVQQKIRNVWRNGAELIV